MVIKKISEARSGIFFVKEYQVEGGADPVSLIRKLQAGTDDVQEVVTYVFSDSDPLGLDTRSFTPEEFFEVVPRMEVYGPELAFDVIVRTEGHPVTVELTHGENSIFINSLDRDVELEDLLGSEPGAGNTDGIITEKTGIHDSISEMAQKLEGVICRSTSANAWQFGKDLTGKRKDAVENSWKAAMMSLLLSECGNFEGYDMDRVIRMCLIQGLSDILSPEPESWTGIIEPGIKGQFIDLLREMKEGKTSEAELFAEIVGKD